MMFQLNSLVAIIISSFIFDGLFVTSSAYCEYGSGSCSNGFQVDYPFWIQKSNNLSYCGYSGFKIKCRDDDGRPLMNIDDHLYYVLSIHYKQQKLRLVDVDVEGQNCPHPKRNISQNSAPLLESQMVKYYIFYNCSIYPDDRYASQYEHIPCLDNYNGYNGTGEPLQVRSYAFYDYNNSDLYQNWYGSCSETVVTPVNALNFTKSAKFGFDLPWSRPLSCDICEGSKGHCYKDETTRDYQCSCGNLGTADGFNCPHDMDTTGGKKLIIIIGVLSGLGGLLLSLFLFCRKVFHLLYHLIFSRWRNETKGAKNVEVLLESYGCLALQRYKYSDIMAMTKSFKHILGKGGYGCVFKGTLRNDGRLVAVKVLNESKGNGEEFINEVATIGRTNHVNVVTLLGFCIEGNKRALIYEFMPNGSLERFIYNENEKTSSTQSTHLGWEKLNQITLGIAKGLEYLHCGCNTRILHFDIKPHNILLDKDFFPKISDFGLAKLCLTRETVVSMVGARGTMGYIAPEISCRNLGGVSHKSDVYSYGMMVLEMIGGRKNLDVTVENMSGIYFPHWIYNQLTRESKVEGLDVIKFEDAGKILEDTRAKKMIIVALWCIQTHPANRPSMSKVVEMLEGSNEELQMPPNPSLDPVSLLNSETSA